MSMPFYVSPEQMMKDRADFARKGIARGRSVAVIRYADGVLFVSENPSAALHKISEIYDRIAFAAVGRYNEFENLRIAGVRLADMRGYSYDRRDVTGRGPGQRLCPDPGHDLLQRGREALRDRDLRRRGGRHARGRPGLPAHLRRPGRRGARLRRDGRRGRVGHDVPRGALHARGCRRDEALKLAAAALGHSETGHRDIPAGDLEVAVLDRTRTQERKFKRLDGQALAGILTAPSRRRRLPARPTVPRGNGRPASNGRPTEQHRRTASGRGDRTDEPPVAP